MCLKEVYGRGQLIFMVKRLIKISFGRINSINTAILIFSKKI